LQSYDMNRAVSDAFRTNLSKFKYADSLKTASPSLFQSTSLETVDVPQNEEDTDDGDILINVNDINESSNNESGGDDSIMGTLIGGSIGVVVFAACTAIYVIRRKKLIKDDKALLAAEDEDLFAEVKDTNDLYKVKEEKSAAPVEDAVVTRILNVRDRDSDTISALEDPTVFRTGNPNKEFDDDDDDMVGSKSNDEWTFTNQTIGIDVEPSSDAFARIYGRSWNTITNSDKMSSSLNRSRNRGTDNLENERIEFIAPSGKLGIVIDTPGPNLPPIIHAIKETSALSHILEVGDQIVEFNGEDTSRLTAIMLTKRITATFDMTERNFVVIRGGDSVFPDLDEKESAESSLF